MTVWASEEPQDTYSEQFVVAKYIPFVEDYDPKSCISYGKWRVDASQKTYWGNGSEIVPNLQNATVGAFVLTYEGNGHIAYIEALEGDSMLISESNYIPGEYGTRSMDLDYELIKGFWTN